MMPILISINFRRHLKELKPLIWRL